MKKLQNILEEWELQCAAGISLKMGVSGFDATLLPCSDEKGLLPLHRLSTLNEVKLGNDNLMLIGKLAYRRLSDGSQPTAEEVAENLRLFTQEKVEIKKPQSPVLPVSGVYAKSVLQVKTEANIDDPIVVMMNSSLKGELHLKLSIKKGARAKVVVFSQLDVTSAQCIQLVQEANSRLELVWIPLQTTAESYLALNAQLDHDANLTLHQPCLDQNVYFSNIIHQLGDRSKVVTYAAAFGEGSDRKRIETSIKSSGKKSFSRINNKAVLADHAECRFYGRQIIEKSATDADSYQEARFLVLDESVKAHNHPVMVIDNNELAAGHAASVGSLDEEQLFYLLSRGLSRGLAERLMSQAYLKPSIEEISIGALCSYLADNLVKKVEQA